MRAVGQNKHFKSSASQEAHRKDGKMEDKVGGGSPAHSGALWGVNI